MSPNKFRSHVLVLPEDDANNDIANGFLLHDALDARAIKVLPCSGGWAKVRKAFLSDHVAEMLKYTKRYMVLLVDFDKEIDRPNQMTEGIPGDLKNRVFVIGVWSEPEDLSRADFDHREDVGTKLADDCYNETRVVWNHDLLQHNSKELNRMTTLLRPILFPSA